VPELHGLLRCEEKKHADEELRRQKAGPKRPNKRTTAQEERIKKRELRD
jgi:hypothetical protein